MELYNLGKVPWDESQLIYHALASLGRECLCLVSPDRPFVCVGFHQDLHQEVDLTYCHSRNIPIFRRNLGGGAVYLDGNQLFFQLVLKRENPVVPKRKEVFYRKFLQPIIEVYRHLGIFAEYKPINDVVVGTRKISGTGVGEMGDCIVFVGNLIVDFDYERMAKVLKVPDAKFRDKIHKTLRENLSTIRRELGTEEANRWDEPALNALMAQAFQRLLGTMTTRPRDPALQKKMEELRALMLTDAWLQQKGKRTGGREIKIRAGINLVQKMFKATGGLIRAEYEIREGRFHNVSLSGDFFCFPAEAVGRLEGRLEGVYLGEAADVLEIFFRDESVEMPGIGKGDWLKVLEPYPSPGWQLRGYDAGAP
ncbi:MAG: biotin/lipoate A/B protein ligase family protein [Deltaproteobacteria bacterium]